LSEEAELVARAQQDPAAFAPLYQQYVRPIYGYCYQRLGTRESAEDATSQVFIKALAALPRYKDRSFRSWLFTIAHHVVADVHRKRPHLPLADDWDVADGGPTPEEHALSAESERSIRALLHHLTPDQREVVELRLAGLNSLEIAAVLKRRPGAIRGTQFRAYHRLRELLSQNKEAGDGI